MDTWGPGYFIALRFSDADEEADSVMVGIDPTQGSGPVALDEDMNAVFKVTSTTQHIVVQQVGVGRSSTQIYDLSGLTLVPSA